MPKKKIEIPADCMPRCGSCAFFKEEDCMRYPPTVIVVENSVGSCYPGVDAEDFCGEFVRRVN